MSYFKNFPSIYYDLNRDEKYKLVTDVLRRITFNQASKDADSIYVKYQIKEGETPEQIAHNLYDNHTLYWVVLLFNDIINKNKQWPMSAETMDVYVSEKYPGSAHYITFDNSTLDEALIKASLGSCSDGTNDVYRTGVQTVEKGYFVTNSLTEPTKTAYITHWEPSFKRFVISSMATGTSFTNDETLYVYDKPDGLVKSICKLWKVSKYAETVHHFIDDNNAELNQLGSYDGLIQAGTDIQKTAIESSVTQDGACANTGQFTLLPFSSTVLGAYMDVSSVGVPAILKWVTNYEYEQAINDEKRSISLLRPNVIADVVTQFEELISS